MRHRTLPKIRCGCKPLSTTLGRGTKSLLLAALTVWEIKQGIPQFPSAWTRKADKEGVPC
jgi:hypothetical protein